jgi:hypothetical protein
MVKRKVGPRVQLEHGQKARYVQYLPLLGFCVVNNNYMLSYDKNSIAIHDISGIPIWRAVFVNGSAYINRGHENEILLD